MEVHVDPHQTPPPRYRSNNAHIVDLPIDQTYQVPNSRNSSTSSSNLTILHGKSMSCSVILLWILSLFLIFILILAIIFSIIYLAIRPKSPKVSITDCTLGNNNYYTVSLLANNTNAHIGISFKKEGIAFLTYKNRLIAKGKSPNDFYVGKRRAREIQINMYYSKDNEGDDKARHEQKELRLSMKMPVKFEIWLVKVSWNMMLSIQCDLELGNNSRSSVGYSNLVSQQCHEKVKFS